MAYDPFLKDSVRAIAERLLEEGRKAGLVRVADGTHRNLPPGVVLCACE